MEKKWLVLRIMGWVALAAMFVPGILLLGLDTYFDYAFSSIFVTPEAWEITAPSLLVSLVIGYVAAMGNDRFEVWIHPVLVILFSVFFLGLLVVFFDNKESLFVLSLLFSLYGWAVQSFSRINFYIVAVLFLLFLLASICLSLISFIGLVGGG